MLQMCTNIMANQVKTPIQNYFEKVLYGNLAFEIPPLWFFTQGLGASENKPTKKLYNTTRGRTHLLPCF
jgi:hypothetical protein